MIHRTLDTGTSPAERTQSAVVAFLADPSTHAGTPVQHIKTHISHIFIAGPRTYKLKRAVKKNFVDYSTALKRKALCEREIKVNVDKAPGIYLGVLPIRETGHGLQLGNSNECETSPDQSAIDYVVEMATFDPQLAFDRLADNRALTLPHIVELADVIASQHAAAARACAKFGGASALAETIEQVATEIAKCATQDLLQQHCLRWRQSVQANLAQHAPQLDARKRHGYVRRCHGDLHLGNICLFEDRPTSFDAIEFSEEIASIDILYDLAFTVMDLLHRGLRPHANALVSRYLNISRDYSGLALLPLFMSLRAAVRAMVAAGIDNDEAVKRLEFATQAATGASNSPPTWLIAVGGLSGSGKSTLAANIAPVIPGLIGAVTIRSDVCRKRLFMVAPEEPLPESAYTPEVGARVYRNMLKDAARALRSGNSVILDATFVEGGNDGSIERLAASTGARFEGLWLSLELASLKERIQRRSSDASDATPAIAAQQWKRMSPNPGWAVLDASQPIKDVAAQALQVIGIEPPD